MMADVFYFLRLRIIDWRVVFFLRLERDQWPACSGLKARGRCLLRHGKPRDFLQERERERASVCYLKRTFLFTKAIALLLFRFTPSAVDMR